MLKNKGATLVAPLIRSMMTQRQALLAPQAYISSAGSALLFSRKFPSLAIALLQARL
jgi:hypothetical protein